MGKRFGLSKSKITAFEQCRKRLWLQTHKAEVAVEDESAQARFAKGNAVGDLACELCPNGIMIKAEPDLRSALERTQELLDSDHYDPLFEATFQHEGVLVRADIMEHDGSDGWHVAEVKSSTGVKDYHLGDMATQLWVMRSAGANISSAAIRHIDRSFILAEAGHYEGLFADTFIEEEVSELEANRETIVREARETLDGSEPEIEMGPQCNQPFECEFQSYCHAQTGAEYPEWPISLLPRTGKRIAEAYAAQGIFDLTEVPEGQLTHKNHEKIRQATASNEPFHDVDSIIAETDGWHFPLIHLDFETCNMAIPRWVGTRPYQQVPFQFSTHIQTEDGQITHHEFLDLSGNDPRQACAAALAGLPEKGSVVAWNASFERRCLKDLAEALPDLAERLLSLADRLVDLKVVAEQHYYHRDQRGSWSIKSVLPTLANELDYGALEVKSGGEAFSAYEEAISSATSMVRHEAIGDALKFYCERDTWAMVVLLAKLRAQEVPQ